MSVDPASTSLIPMVQGSNVVVFTWLLTASAIGTPISGVGFTDRSFQIEGTFGAGGTVIVEGSNDGANYHTLRDPFSNLLSFTSSDLKQVTEIGLYIRPRVSGGDGSTSITVTAVVCSHQPSFS